MFMLEIHTDVTTILLHNVYIQFISIKFVQIYYKSNKRRIGYRISRNTLYQTLYIKIQSTN
jgi:hypothetical protein